MSGNIFWGESFTLGNPSRQSWDVTAPGAMQAPGVLECVFYADNSINGKVMFGIEGDATEGTLNIIKSSSANVTTRRAFATNCLLKGDKGKVFVDFRSDDTQIDYANLDYWLLSYPMNTESLFSFSDSNTQNRIGFHLEPSKEYRIDYDGRPFAQTNGADFIFPDKLTAPQGKMGQWRRTAHNNQQRPFRCRKRARVPSREL